MTTNSLYDLIQKDGIEIFETDLPRTISFAMLDEDGEPWIAIDLKRVLTDGELKLRLCHEKNHHKTGLLYDRISIYETRDRYETRVQRRTIRELLPEELLDEAYAQGCTELWQIAEYVGYPERFVQEAIDYYKIAD